MCKVIWKPSGKNFSLIDAIENIYDSWEKVKISTLMGVCNYNPMDGHVELKTSVKKKKKTQCSENSNIIRIRSETWRSDWITTISWQIFKRLGATSYWWA